MTKPLTVKSYLPESLLLEGKQQLAARICTEDCAVIEIANNYRILASRGEGLLPDTDFRTAIDMSPAEEITLTHAIYTNKRIFLKVHQRPLLIFADWLTDTGLLVAILPACDPSAAWEALTSLSRIDFTILFKRARKKCSADLCRQALRILSDIFSYTDILFANRAESDRHLIPRIAAFAGCRLDSETIFALSRNGVLPHPPKASAFLLCTLLALRNREGTLETDGEKPLDVCYRVTVQTAYGKKPSQSLPLPAFASAACFQDCEIHQGNNSATLIFSEPTVASMFSAGVFEGAGRILLRIEQIHISA